MEGIREKFTQIEDSRHEGYIKNKLIDVLILVKGIAVIGIGYVLPVELIVKPDLIDMDTKNLYFYSYDKATNTYKWIEKPGY